MQEDRLREQAEKKKRIEDQQEERQRKKEEKQKMIEDQKEERQRIQEEKRKMIEDLKEGKRKTQFFEITDEEPKTQFTHEREQVKDKQHGTKIDKHTGLKYWKRQSIGYIRDQLNLRKINIDDSLITGKLTQFDGILGRKITTRIKKITKEELIGMLLEGSKTV